MKSLSPFTARLFVVFLSIVATGGSLELALRIRKGELFSANNQILKKVKKRPNPCLSEPDSRLGWKTKLGQSSWVPAKRISSIKSYVSSNQLGLRNNGGHLPETKGAVGILALGDSFTFGDEVSDWETWPAQLEHLTGQPVFNAGTCTYGLDQAYLRYLEIQPLLKLKAIIIEITPDSIERTERTGMMTYFFKRHVTKPYFLLDAGRLKEHPAQMLDPVIEYEKLDLVRNVLGYSFVLDFIFRKTALVWWWGIPGPQSYPKEFKTGFDGYAVSCKILESWKSSLNANKLKGLVLIQDYFNFGTFTNNLDKVAGCAQRLGFEIKVIV